MQSIFIAIKGSLNHTFQNFTVVKIVACSEGKVKSKTQGNTNKVMKLISYAKSKTCAIFQ